MESRPRALRRQGRAPVGATDGSAAPEATPTQSGFLGRHRRAAAHRARCRPDGRVRVLRGSSDRRPRADPRASARRRCLVVRARGAPRGALVLRRDRALPRRVLPPREADGMADQLLRSRSRAVRPPRSSRPPAPAASRSPCGRFARPAYLRPRSRAEWFAIEILTYGVYMAALGRSVGFGLWFGVFAGPAPVGLTLVPGPVRRGGDHDRRLDAVLRRAGGAVSAPAGRRRAWASPAAAAARGRAPALAPIRAARGDRDVSPSRFVRARRDRRVGIRHRRRCGRLFKLSATRHPRRCW